MHKWLFDPMDFAEPTNHKTEGPLVPKLSWIYILLLIIAVAAFSKACFCGCSLAGIVGSNPAGST